MNTYVEELAEELWRECSEAEDWDEYTEEMAEFRYDAGIVMSSVVWDIAHHLEVMGADESLAILTRWAREKGVIIRWRGDGELTVSY